MDPQIEKFLSVYAAKALEGPGFIASAPKEKEEFKGKILNYLSDLTSETLLQNLNEEQLKELEAMPDLETDEAQTKISLMSASIPGFIFILEEKFQQAAQEIGRSGKIPGPVVPQNT